MENRLEWIDIAKGILILLVVVGHIFPIQMECELAEKFRLWIYSCHIPAFFIINGWLKGKGSFLSLQHFYDVLFRQKRIWIMYFFFGAIFFVRFLIQIICGYNTINEGFLFIEHILLGVGEGVLWFLPAFLIAEWLFYFCMRSKTLRGGVLAIFICLYVGKYALPIKNISEISSVPLLLYIVLMRSFVSLIFMFIGYCVNKYRLFENRLLMSLSCLSVFAYLNYDVDINNLVFHNELLYLIFAVLGCMLVINIAQCIANFDRFSLIFSLFGKESLFVMLTHTIFFVIQFSLLISSSFLSSQTSILLTAIVISIIMEYMLIYIKTLLTKRFNVLKKYPILG